MLATLIIGSNAYAQFLNKGCVDIEGIKSFPKVEDLEVVFGPLISKQYVMSDLGGYNKYIFDGVVI